MATLPKGCRFLMLIFSQKVELPSFVKKKLFLTIFTRTIYLCELYRKSGIVGNLLIGIKILSWHNSWGKQQCIGVRMRLIMSWIWRISDGV